MCQFTWHIRELYSRTTARQAYGVRMYRRHLSPKHYTRTLRRQHQSVTICDVGLAVFNLGSRLLLCTIDYVEHTRPIIETMMIHSVPRGDISMFYRCRVKVCNFPRVRGTRWFCNDMVPCPCNLRNAIWSIVFINSGRRNLRHFLHWMISQL